jgi:hypothetical protein
MGKEMEMELRCLYLGWDDLGWRHTQRCGTRRFDLSSLHSAQAYTLLSSLHIGRQDAQRYTFYFFTSFVLNLRSLVFGIQCKSFARYDICSTSCYPERISVTRWPSQSKY